MYLNYYAIDSICAITLSIRTKNGGSAYTHLTNFRVHNTPNPPNESPVIVFYTNERKFITNFYKLLFSPSGYSDGLLCEARVYFKHKPKDYIRINFTVYNDENKNNLSIYNDGAYSEPTKFYDGVEITTPKTNATADNDFVRSISIDYFSAEDKSSTNDTPISEATE